MYTLPHFQQCTFPVRGNYGMVTIPVIYIRLRLLAFQKSDWSDAWLLVTRIEPASYSRNLVHITYYSGH